MEALLTNIEWTPTIVSAVVAFLAGWLWYTPAVFLNPWLKGIGEPVWKAPMWMGMFSQAASTLFLAVIFNIAMNTGQASLAILVTLMLAGFIKANGLYCGKNKQAISVEVVYILVMGLLLYAVNMVM